MEYVILKIARLLRDSGIQVSQSEVVDCTRLVGMAGTETADRLSFYHLVNATMIKTSWGVDYAMWLIELYYGPDVETAGDRLGVLRIGSRSGKRSVGAGSTGLVAPLEFLLEAVISGRIKPLYAALRNMDLQLDIRIEGKREALKELQWRSGWEQTHKTVREAYARKELSEEEFAAAMKTLERWTLLLENEVEQQLARNMGHDILMEKMKCRNPGKIAFEESDDAQMDIISREILKLGKKMAVRKGRRRKRGMRGEVSLSRSIRESMKTGGVPMKLIRMEKRPARLDLWLLCDLSNSMSRFIHFMLMLVYTARKRYTGIRAFVFVDMLVEATAFLREKEWSSAIRALWETEGYNLTGYSHYGNVLRQFQKRYLPSLARNTTVLILGDAKNNRNEVDGGDVLADIRKRAAALYWLNPLDPGLWQKDDCIMTAYRKHCTAVFPCANIEELERFVTSI